MQVALLFALVAGGAALSHPDYHKGTTEKLEKLAENNNVQRAGAALLSLQKKVFQKMDGDDVYLAAQNMAGVIVFGLVAAYIFKNYVKMPEHDPLMKAPDMQTWSSGPFNCFESMPICAWSCFCPAVRWAGNMDQVKLLDFWPAVAIFISLEALGTVPALSLCGMVLLCVMIYYRNKMRHVFNMPNANAPMTVCGDCAFVCCCSCCAIAQEARHLEVACKVNHEAVAAQRPVMEQAPAQERA